MAKHEEQWGVYSTVIDDVFSTVVVDLGWIEELPQPDRPVSIRLVVPFKDPGEDGFGTERERNQINDADDALVARFAHAAKAVCVARIRGGGQLEWYFFGPSADRIDAAAAGAVGASLPGYAWEVASLEDPEWEVYTEFLFPDEAIQRRMGDEMVVRQMEESGDPLTVPRAVEHFAYFQERSGAERFGDWARSREFETIIGDPNHSEDGNLCVRLKHETPVDLDTINGVTEMLRVEAEEHGGYYDGWEAFVVRPDGRSMEDAMEEEGEDEGDASEPD